MSEPSPIQETMDARDDDVLCNLMEELTDKAQAGANLDLDDYIQRFPQYASQLRHMSITLTALADLARSVDGPTVATNSGTASAPTHTGVLGDYRILREVGRGGMGVVYEAEQISLGRHVALKILPLAAVFDQRQLRRFRNEAQAAAHLHHQNIVPVYGVGSERGVHYYAMQFIEGQSLDVIIRALQQDRRLQTKDTVSGELPELTITQAPTSGLAEKARESSQGSLPSPAADTVCLAAAELSTIRTRSPAAYYRNVARMMLQVAGALEHAHQEGVLHRDIKPSNLMLDDSGKVWVTDFGLARIENQPGLTRSGDIVGTLGYMSPEQVKARHGVVDHRTDIYALGATFYELLSLHRVFDASNKQAMMQPMNLDRSARLIDRFRVNWKRSL